MRPDLEPILDRVPGWAHASDLGVQPIGGLTNANYLVTVNAERSVLRVSGQNSFPRLPTRPIWNAPPDRCTQPEPVLY